MHVSPTLPFDEIWSKQIGSLRQQLNVFFSAYQIGIDRKMHFQSELAHLFKQTFSIALPTYIEQRAHYERQLILSINRKLKQDGLILRRLANRINVFYLAKEQDWKKKIDDYFIKTTSYELMTIINDSNPIQPQIDEMVKSIDFVLQTMRQNRLISDEHLKKIRLKSSNYQLPTLDFLPRIEDDGHIIVQPALSACHRCPIKSIARFLDELFQPLYESCSLSTTVSTGSDFIHRLIPYDVSHLLPKTRFITYQINDLYQLFSHRHLLDALSEFLNNVLPVGRHQNLTINALVELTGVVLRNNVFIYENRIYRYVKGSPLSLPLTRTLANIYLHEWQKSLVNQLGRFEEFYVRYHDTAFLTWNGREDKLHAALDELNQKHPDIHITTTIGSSAIFLDAYVENRSGRLFSRVHHRSHEIFFTLPYVIGHPRLYYRQWFQWAMRRAVRYSIKRVDFDQERLYIELTFLANGYSMEFLQMNLSNFYRKYFIVPPPVHMDVKMYEILRERVMNAIRLEEDYRRMQLKWKQNGQLIQLNYHYDWGQRCDFNEKFKRLWLELIKNDKAFASIELKLKLNTIHCYTLNALLTS